jgi:cytochrome P450
MAFNAFGPANDLVRADAHRAADLSAWVAERCAREALTGDGFGARIWAAADRGDLTPDQAPLVVRSLLTAGVDTTVRGLAAALCAFATHLEQWARLRDRSRLARAAFDEAVRR